MKSNISDRIIVFLCLLIIVLKVIIYIQYQFNFSLSFGGGSDANGYNTYALGKSFIATSLWPIILRWLNDLGFYSRDGVIIFYQLLSIIIIPTLSVRLIYKELYFCDKKIIYLLFLLVSFYPTLSKFSLDIYRDTMMVFIFLCGLFFIKGTIDKYKILFIGVVLISWLLFLFRPYLGFSFLVSFLLFPILSKFSNYKIIFCCYILGLVCFKQTGLMEPLLEYRGDGWDQGGSSLGIGLINSNIITFPLLFIASFCAQVFGFFIPNLMSLIVFVTESIPFLIAFFFVMRNIKLSTSFVYYLITFFFVYNAIWVIGNDNLGTAVRLRMYSYIAIYIAAAIIYLRKKKLEQ